MFTEWNGRLRKIVVAWSRLEVVKADRDKKRTMPNGMSSCKTTITCSVVTPCRVSTLMVASSRSGTSAGPNSVSSTWSSTWSTSWSTTGVRCLSAVNSAGSSDGLARWGSGPRISRTVSSVAVSDVDNCSAGAYNKSARTVVNVEKND